MKKQTHEAPDETLLTLWMDGELDGDELLRVEAWAREHPELLAERDAVRAMVENIRANVPAGVEPPYPDFFNQRILRHIEEEAEPAGGLGNADQGISIWHRFSARWNRWLAFPAAAGAMALCFYLGTRVSDTPEQAGRIVAVTAPPTIYTPDGDVRAAMFSSEEAGATVIVLEGLEDIPDELEMVSKVRRRQSNHYKTVMVSAERVF